MSAYNFGMLTAGLPDLSQRLASTAPQDASYFQSQQNDWLANWQSQYDAAAPIYHPGSGPDYSAVFNPFDAAADKLQAADPGRFGANYDPNANSAWDMQIVQNAFGGDQAAQQQINAHLAAVGSGPASFSDQGSPGWYDDSARQALNAQKATQQGVFAQQLAGVTQNQQTQQNAYNQSNGGSFNGGIINASYGTPFGGNTDATNLTQVDGVTMPQNQPWGMAGYGGPTGGTSQGGFGGGWGQNASGTQPTGWGGPFTNKNPWAAS